MQSEILFGGGNGLALLLRVRFQSLLTVRGTERDSKSEGRESGHHGPVVSHAVTL